MSAKTTKRPTAREQIKATVKETREANAQAHADRMGSCTAAVEAAPAVPVRKIPARVSGKPKKLALTSPAKMGAARKTNKARIAATKRAKDAAEGRGRDWSALRSVTPEQAEQYTELLLAGTTAKAAGETTGLDAKSRVAVERVLIRGGYKFHRELNPARDKADPMTRFLYRIEAP